MNTTTENILPVRLEDGTVLDPFIVQLLGQRGIIGQQSISEFLEPKLSELPSPFLMKGMEKAVRIIEKALLNKDPILIWGDYDVDGTTSTALLLRFFNYLGCDAKYYIPNRLTEGYGLQEDALKRISNENPGQNRLLITVDNGISAHGAVDLATELGYKTIITDHHTPPPKEVRANAVLNPKQTDCSFPAKNLAGVGVAFYLAMGIRSYLNRKNFFGDSRTAPNLKSLLDLVAVGTVADMVPLHGINRILVRAGMETLSQQGNLGLTALCRGSNLDPTFIRSEDISFQIAPKINAAGRLGFAGRAVDLLLSKTKKEGQTIAMELINNNERRKNINLQELAKAIQEIEKSEITDKYSTVIAGEYHVGVAGIVASNLVEKYQKPSVVLCRTEGNIYKGSARSVPGVDLYIAIERCQDLLLGFGGHKMAAGLSISHDNIREFRMLFDESVFQQTQGVPVEVTEEVDADIRIEDLFKNNTLRQLHMFEPFGQGNPHPIFRDTESSFSEITPIGKDKRHLRLRLVGSGGKATTAIAFSMGSLVEQCRTNKDKEIMYTPSVNYFRGKRSWQVRITNIIFGKA